MKRFVSPKWAAFAAITLCSVVALAQSGLVNIDFTARGMRAGFWSGASGLASATNKVTNMLAASVDWNFASSTIVCTDSRPVTITGAAVGDPCMVGPPAAPAANSSFTCYVSAADTVYLRHCAAGTAADPGDAGYNLRIISNQ